jgi:HlyD family secretion protein
MLFPLRRNPQFRPLGLSRLLAVVLSFSLAGAVDMPVRQPAPGDTHLMGTVEPDVIDVCAHVSGFITSLGPDPRGATDPQFAGKSIDFTTPVEAGALLAQLDDGPYRLQVARAEAGVQYVEAQLQKATATVALAQAKLADSKARGKAGLGDDPRAEPEIRVAQAEVVVRQAALARARVVLEKALAELKETQIRAPAAGIIVDNRAMVGQEVGLQNERGLFLLAKAPLHLELWVSVPEEKVGQVHSGEGVHFTSLAYPGKVFTGKVRQVRLNATMTQTKVTYIAVIAFDRGDGPQLLPYMTAHITLDPQQ